MEVLKIRVQFGNILCNLVASKWTTICLRSIGLVETWVRIPPNAKNLSHRNEMCADHPVVSIRRLPVTGEQICATTITLRKKLKKEDLSFSAQVCG